MNLHEFHHLVQDIQKNLPCRGCKHPFHENDIRVIGTLYNEAFFHAECHQCRGCTIIAGLLHEASDHSQPQQRNAMQRVQRKIKKSANGANLRIMSTDDILDMHNFLKEFNGDFTALFQAKL